SFRCLAFFFSSRRRHTRWPRDWSSDVCSSDLHIREDASVVIRPMGLLGDKFVEILPGTPSKPPLAPGGVLVGQAEADIGGIAAGATTTIENVNAAIKDIQRVLLAINQGEGTAGKLLTD